MTMCCCVSSLRVGVIGDGVGGVYCCDVTSVWLYPSTLSEATLVTSDATLHLSYMDNQTTQPLGWKLGGLSLTLIMLLDLIVSSVTL